MEVSCEGCKLGLENQLAHLSGCLKRFYTINISSSHISTADEDGVHDIYVINNKVKYGIFTELLRIIENKLLDLPPDEIHVVVSDKQIYDVLNGKCYGKVSYYTFFLKFKSFNVCLKPFKNSPDV